MPCPSHGNSQVCRTALSAATLFETLPGIKRAASRDILLLGLRSERERQRLSGCHEDLLWTCVGVSQIDRVVEAVEESLKGNSVHLLAKKKLPRLDLPKVWGITSILHPEHLHM